jgi:hypothetical protein
VIDGLAMALRQDYCMSNSMHLQFFLPFHFSFSPVPSVVGLMLARWTVFGHPRFGLKHWRRGIKSNKALHTIEDDEEEP